MGKRLVELGDEDRIMHLVLAPAVRLMKLRRYYPDQALTGISGVMIGTLVLKVGMSQYVNDK